MGDVETIDALVAALQEAEGETLPMTAIAEFFPGISWGQLKANDFVASEPNSNGVRNLTSPGNPPPDPPDDSIKGGRGKKQKEVVDLGAETVAEVSTFIDEAGGVVPMSRI